MVKKIIFILYILVLVCMAAATIVEKSQGTDYAHAHYYGAWWFILIWAVLAALGAFYIIKRKVKCASTLALHLSFIIILAGALLTHISAKRGMIHLRIGQPTDTYMAQDEEQGMQEEKLPFSLCMQNLQQAISKMLYCQRKLQRSLASFIFSTTTASVRYRPLPSISARRYMEPGAIWD